MTTSLYKKGLVLGIICLFIGASIVPSISGADKELIETTMNTYLPTEEWDAIPEEWDLDITEELEVTEDSHVQSAVSKLAVSPRIFDIMEAGKTTANDKTIGCCLIIDSNKIYVGGSTYHNGDWDAYICKFDLSSGNPVFNWETTFDYMGNDEAISGLAYDAGKVFAIGFSDKGGGRQILWKFNCITGSLDGYVVKGTNSQPNVGVAIEYWYDGYLYTIGSRKNSDGNYRVLINKYSTNLDYEWGYYLNPYPPGLSYGYDLDVSNGYAYITGDCCYSAGKPSYAWPCMIKFDINSESTVWSDIYGSAEYRQKSASCLRDGDRVYYVGYEYDTTSPVDYQIYLAYVRESDGWQDGTIDRRWGSSQYPDFGNDIIEFADKFYVTGTTESYGAGSFDALLLKMDSSFNEIWFKTWGGSQDEEMLNAFEYGSHIYTVGYTDSFGSESRNALLLKYHTSGSLKWDHVWSSGEDTDPPPTIEITYPQPGYLYASFTGSTGIPIFFFGDLCLFIMRDMEVTAESEGADKVEFTLSKDGNIIDSGQVYSQNDVFTYNFGRPGIGLYSITAEAYKNGMVTSSDSVGLVFSIS